MTIETFFNMGPEELQQLAGQLAQLGPPEALQNLPQLPAEALGPLPPPQRQPGNVVAQALAQPAPGTTPQPPAPTQPPQPATQPQQQKPLDLGLALSQLRSNPPPEVIRPPGGSTNVGRGTPAQNLIAALYQGIPLPRGGIRGL